MLGCDGCVKCCELIAVPEIGKPHNELCRHAVPGAGCSLHPSQGGSGQPVSCHHFYCLWLSSQRLGPEHRMPPEMRPDRCGVVFGPIDEKNARRLNVNVDPKTPDAWRDPEVLRWITRVVSNGNEVVMNVGEAQVRFAVGVRTVIVGGKEEAK